MQLNGIRIVVVALIFVAVAAVVWQCGGANYAESCRDAARQRQWKQLASLSQAWSDAEPDEAEAWMYRAEAARKQSDLVSADRFLGKIAPSSRFGVRALEARLELQFGPLNQPLAAVESCQTLLVCDPASKVAHQRLIYFFAFTLQRRKLMDEVRDAVARGCEPREAYGYLFLADSLVLSNAGSQNARWLESDPTSELFAVAQAIHIAETLEGQIPRDDPEVLATMKEAIERRDRTLRELLQKYPQNLELLAFFLRQAVERGDVARVNKLLLQSPDAAEFDNRFWRYRGWLLQSDNQLEEAESAYQQALKLHPLDWTTRHLLAGLKRRQGKLKEAGILEQVVLRANELRRQFQQQDTMRNVPPPLLKGLAEYSAECQDLLIAESLRSQLNRFGKANGSRP
ncbi:MAG: hypothetical protein ACKV2Q_09825 [Planctomycetaceae bacterium]